MIRASAGVSVTVWCNGRIPIGAYGMTISRAKYFAVNMQLKAQHSSQWGETVVSYIKNYIRSFNKQQN